MKFLAKRLRWILVGAGAAWLLDPERGPQRRERLVERFRELVARSGLSSSPSELAMDEDFVTDVAWATAHDAHTSDDERRLAGSLR